MRGSAASNADLRRQSSWLFNLPGPVIPLSRARISPISTSLRSAICIGEQRLANFR